MRSEYPKQRPRGQSGKWLFGIVIVAGLMGLALILYFQ
jgi:hypothetical protein